MASGQARSPDSLPVPSSAQIALALVTICSKPPQLSIQEHLVNIRKAVIVNSAGTSVRPPPTIDPSLFWKNAFETSQREKSALQEELKRLHTETESNQQPSKPSDKRKPESQEVVQANIHSKRRKMQAASPPNADSLPPELEAAPVVKKLLNAIFNLKQSNLSQTMPTATMCTRVSAVCQAMVNCINNPHTAVIDASKDATSLQMAFQEMCPRVLNAYKLLLPTIENLSTFDDTLSHMVTSLSAFFLTMLGRLHRLILDELTRREEVERAKTKRPKSNSKAAQRSPERDEAAFIESATCLTRTIQSIIASPNLKNANHCRLLKALLSGLLDHAGSSLSLLIFADPQSDNNGIEQPMGMQHVAHIDTDSAILAAELEAPYLVAVLKSTLAYLKDHCVDMPLRSKEIISGSREVPNTRALADRIENRLQDTLMRGVFGDEDQKFRKALTREPSPEINDVEETLSEAREEEDKTLWFVGQLWELLGWDILSGKMLGRS